jgi:type IV secretion system protein TrbL
MITLIESYFLVAVSALFIAFGASSYTLPMAREYIGMTVAVGIKLMMLYVMIAIGVQLGSDWAQLINQATQAKDWSTYLGVAVGSIIYYLIVKSVPSKIASAASHSFAISHMDNITGATTGSVAKTAAGVLMGVGAFEMAGAALRATGGSANGLHGKMSSFAGQGSSGLDGAASGVQGNQSASLASGMLTHFGSSHSGGISDISPSGGRSGGSLITPSVIHLPGPEPANRKGQIDLFAASN